jgi:hypothetical protein
MLKTLLYRSKPDFFQVKNGENSPQQKKKKKKKKTPA